jgi:hypothetical protein
MQCNSTISLQASLFESWGTKYAASIARNKVLSFSCYSNGILPKKERQRAYFFAMSNSGAVEIFHLCLIFLLDAEPRQYAQKARSPFWKYPNSSQKIAARVTALIIAQN